jgi:hypothetical protein
MPTSAPGLDVADLDVVEQQGGLVGAGAVSRADNSARFRLTA